jgi:hypothetical protein
MSRRLLVLSCVWCVLGGACAPKGEPVLTLAPDRTIFDGRTERVSVRVRAFDPDGEPSGGLVSLTATVGHFVGPADLVLEEGAATATFAPVRRAPSAASRTRAAMSRSTACSPPSPRAKARYSSIMCSISMRSCFMA